MCSVLGKEHRMGVLKTFKGEIPQMAISGVRRARLTDGPVQTT